MDSNMRSRSPDNGDAKPSFRKPINDAANRKYRRRSPFSRSTSSSSGSPKYGRSPSPAFSREDPTKNADDLQRRKNDRREDRDSGRRRSDKGGNSYRHAERQSYGSSHDYRRHADDYSRYHRHAEGNERSYQSTSWSDRELRNGTRSDHTRQESEHDRSRDYSRYEDKYGRDKPNDEGHRSKDKERETSILERQKHKDKDSSSDKALSGRRHFNSNVDEIKTGEQDRRTRDRGGRDDTRDYRRSLGDYKNDHASCFEESRGHGKDSTTAGESGGNRRNETHKSNTKELDGQKGDAIEKRKHDDRESNSHKESYDAHKSNTKELDGQKGDVIEKRKHDDRESDNHKGRYNREPDEKGYRTSSYRERDRRNQQFQDKTSRSNEDHESSAKKLKLCNSDEGTGYVKDADERPPSSSKQAREIVKKVILEPAQSSANEAETANDLNAAKVAAMKAAELVNRNLIGGGYMSTDQKKKLLWGNKKDTAAEEPGYRWDMPLFSDQERQEKFNKLMGVKGDPKPENKPNDKDGSGLLQEEKQKELQLDLEKQYIAGLRRRDGRTVGLGL